MKSLKSINFIENPQEIQTLNMDMIRGGVAIQEDTMGCNCRGGHATYNAQVDKDRLDRIPLN